MTDRPRDAAREDGARRYEISVVPNEHGGFYARIPDFPTLFTGGETYEEALRNALEAIELMLEEHADRGQPAPEPLAAFSGRFNVRVPRSLHRELVRRAESQGLSLNAMVTQLLTRATGLESARGETSTVLDRWPRASAVAQDVEPYDP